MDEILDIIFGIISEDSKWYHCPHCKIGMDFNDIVSEITAVRVAGSGYIYRCKNCNKKFRMLQ